MTQATAESRRQLRTPARPHTTTHLTTIDVAKLDDKHSSSRAVFGNLEQLDNAGKTRIARKGGCNIGEGNLEDLRDDDLAGRQCISAADFHVWSLPEANGSGDLASTNAIAKASKELHVVPVTPRGRA